MSSRFCIKCRFLPGEHHQIQQLQCWEPELFQCTNFCWPAKQHHSTVSFQESGGRAAQNCFEYFRSYFEGDWIKGEAIVLTWKVNSCILSRQDKYGFEVIAGNRLQMNFCTLCHHTDTKHFCL